MHSLVKAVAQIWAEKAGNSSALKHFRHMYTGHALGISICGCSLFYKREQ